MNWINRKDAMPEYDKRVLVFSPLYKNQEMRFRIMNGEFLKWAIEATHWTYLTEPSEANHETNDVQ